jgi:hypothetical protein
MALTPEQQKEYADKMIRHLEVVMNAPCTSFEGYPFSNNGNSVQIKAVIECFNDNVKNKLMERLNYMLKHGNFVDSRFHYKLKATKLMRHEGGYQFEAKEEDEEQYLIGDCLRNSPVSNLWTKYQTYNDFTNDCQIRFSRDEPFGNTTARVVTFCAYEAVPLYIMLWLYRELLWFGSPTRQCMGRVEIIETDGLPDGEDWICWHSSLITWD